MPIVESKPVARRRSRFASVAAGREETGDELSLSAYFRSKAIFDRVLAVLLLAPGLPLIALLVLLVRLTSRGPGIYRQIRVGRNGRNFKIYKIRTMRHDAESASGPVWRKPPTTRESLAWAKCCGSSIWTNFPNCSTC